MALESGCNAHPFAERSRLARESVFSLLQPLQCIPPSVLFPTLEREWGPFSNQHRQRVEGLARPRLRPGGPADGRRGPSGAASASHRPGLPGHMAAPNLNSPRQSLDRLAGDEALRRLCGGNSVREGPRQRWSRPSPRGPGTSEAVPGRARVEDASLPRTARLERQRAMTLTRR